MKTPGQPSDRANLYAKILLALVVSAIAALLLQSEVRNYMTLSSIKEHRDFLVEYYQEYPATTILIFLSAYILSAALSIPGSTLFTIAAGAVFGFSLGTALTVTASTIGAGLAFLLSRFLIGNWVQRRFQSQLKKMNQELKTNGAWYLLSLRIIPTFPYFLVNIAMGLTPIRLGTFLFVSSIGMIPGSMAYVNAGKELGSLTSLSSIFSARTLLAFALLGAIPLVARAGIFLMSRYRKKNQT